MEPNRRVKLYVEGSVVSVTFDGRRIWSIRCLSPDDAASYAAATRAYFVPQGHRKNPWGTDAVLVVMGKSYRGWWYDEFCDTTLDQGEGLSQ